MSSLVFLIYLAAMGVSILLGRQAKRQQREIALELARLGRPLPGVRTRIQILEALLSIAIGGVLIVPAVQGFWMIFRTPLLVAQTGTGMGDFYSILLASGVTLMFLGCKTLRQNLINRRNVSRAQ